MKTKNSTNRVLSAEAENEQSRLAPVSGCRDSAVSAHAMILGSLDQQLLASGFTINTEYEGSFDLPDYWPDEPLLKAGIRTRKGWKRSDCWKLYIQYLEWHAKAGR